MANVKPQYFYCVIIHLFQEAEMLFIIFTHKIDDESAPEVEFSSHSTATRVQATVENEYTISVTAPGTCFLEVVCIFIV